MSFALMGAMGLVLDSGRVYATHSQMQAFADYVALAAANELDGESDSIARASQAAYGIVDGSEGKILQEKDSGGVVLNIERLYFYSDLNTASGWQNNMADSQEFLLGFTDQALGSTDAAASESATYVTAIVEQRSLYTLAGMLSQHVRNMAATTYSTENGGGDNVSVGTYEPARVAASATAGLTRETCMDLSTLVFCNPWEGMELSEDLPQTDADGKPITERFAQENMVGRSIRYWAPNYGPSINRTPVTDGTSFPGSFFDYDVKNQLFTISSGVVDSVDACSFTYLQTYFLMDGETLADESGPSYLEIRDRCLLARAQTEQVCFEDNKIDVRPANGPTILSGINIAFDIYNEPFNQVIAQTDLYLPLASEGGVNMSLSQFFEPDAVVAHPFERMIDYTGDGVIDNDDYEVFDKTGDTDGTPGIDNNFFENFDLQYATVPAPYMSGMRDFVKDMGIHPCHLDDYDERLPGSPIEDSACEIDFVGDDSFATLTDIISAVAQYHGVTPRSFTDENGERIELGGSWHEIYEMSRTQYAASAGALSSAATDVSRMDGNDGNEPDPVLANNFEDLGNGLIGTLTENLSGVTEPARGDNLLYDSSTNPDAITNDNASLKLSPLQTDHDYPFWGLPGEVHPMESFNARTGATSLTYPEHERRVLKAAFVNCVAATTAGADDSGIYSAELLDVVDVFLPRPAGMFCGLDSIERRTSHSDPQLYEVSLMTCNIQDQVETELFIETVGLNEDVPTVLYTAQLVR